MDEIIFSQNFNLVSIRITKNYCLLSDKEQFKINPNILNFDEFSQNTFSTRKTETNIYHSKAEMPRKNTRYFYLSSDIPSIEYKSTKWLFTDKIKHIKKHYSNPFAEIQINRFTKTIRKSGDDIKFTIVIYKKNRYKNHRYFKIEKTIFGFKINTRTGNFTTYTNHLNNKKITMIRVNSFFSLFNVINKIENSMLLTKGDLLCKSNHKLMADYYHNFANNLFITKINEILLEHTPQYNGLISQVKNIHGNNRLLDLVAQFFINKNNIKVPNLYMDLLVNKYPTKAFLKKNENKLIASILDKMRIKSKSTIKLVHTHFDHLNIIERLEIILNLIGYENFHKHISNLDQRFFSEKCTYTMIRKNLGKLETNLTDLEKNNIIMILNNSIELSNNIYGEVKIYTTNIINELYDHLFMLYKVKTVFEDTKINATNLNTFEEEHKELTKVFQQVKKGYYVEYVFDEKLMEYIKEPIHTDGGIFYPYLLTNDSEYSREGSHMHHCVASYSERTDSVIISLRENDIENKQRVTSEYSVFNKDCVQSKYFCNTAPPIRFIPALEILNKRIKEWVGSIKSLELKKIKIDPNKKILLEETAVADEFFMFNAF